MLTGKAVERSGGGAICSVGFQQAVNGAVLDDVRLNVQDEDSGSYFVEIEVKSGIHFRPSDPDFSETVRRARDAIANRGHDNDDVFILVVPSSSTNLEHVSRLIDNAHAKSAVEFDALLNGATSNAQRRIASAFRSTLGARTNDDLWKFFQRFSVYAFDFDQTPSHWRQLAEGYLENAFETTIHAASEIFDHLTRIVEANAKVAGILKPGELLAQLRKSLGDLADPSNLRLVTRRIGQFSRFAASDVENMIHGLHLNRAGRHSDLRTAINRADTVLIHGQSGHGKSALLKAHYEEVGSSGPALFLSARRIALTNGWFGLANQLGINPSFRTLARVLEGNPLGPILFLDGLSEIDTPESQSVVNDLLFGLTDELGSRKSLKVIASTREPTLPPWLKTSRGSSPAIVSLLDATEDELEQIGTRFRALRLLLTRSEGNPVLHSLFALRIILDDRAAPAFAGSEVLSEIDVARVWWDNIVGSGSAGPSKQRALQLIAQELLSSPTRSFLGDSVQPNALAALRTEQLIIRDQQRDIYFFSHDLIQDWALMRLLDRNRGALLNTLDTLGNPPYLSRAVSLIAQAAFEDPQERSWFFDARQKLAGAATLHWRSAFDRAIVSSTKALPILRELHEKLLENEAELLRALLNTLTSAEIDPNASLLEAFRTSDPNSDSDGLEFLDPLPRYSVWAPILLLALELGDLIPPSAFLDVFRAFAIWQKHTVGDMPLRLAIARQVVKWVEGTTIYRPIRGDTFVNCLRDIITHSGDVAPQLISQYLTNISSGTSRDFAMHIIKGSGRLPQDIPDDFRDFATRTLIRERSDLRRSRDGDLYSLNHEFGLRGQMSLYPPSPVQGPFLALLRGSEKDGIALVNALLNVATEEYLTAFAGRNSVRPLPTKITTGRKSVALWGDEYVYQWFRPMSAGSAVATSALMALELYAEQQLEDGRDAETLFAVILENAKSVAIAGVLMSLTLEYPQRCLKAALPLVCAPTLWRMEVPRLLLDQTIALGNISYSQPRHSSLRTINEQRNARPQRTLQIANLPGLYVLSRDQRLSSRFQKLKNTPDDAARLWDRESVNESSETVNLIRAFADRNNYRLVREKDHDCVRFERPPLAKEAQERLDVGNAVQKAIALEMWGASTALRNKFGDQFTPVSADAAIADLRDLRQDELLRGSEEFSFYSNRAIVDASAAILALATGDPTVPADVVKRAFGIVLETGRTLSAASWNKKHDDVDRLDGRRVVAAGLGYAKALNLASDELDPLIIGAAGSGLLHVGEAVVRGTASLWSTNVSYASNVLRVYLVAASDKDGRSPVSLDDFHRRVAAGRLDVPAIASTSRRGVAFYALGLALQHIPIEEFPAGTPALTIFAGIVNDYLKRAEHDQKIVDRDHLTEWFQGFAGLYAVLEARRIQGFDVADACCSRVCAMAGTLRAGTQHVYASAPRIAGNRPEINSLLENHRELPYRRALESN